MCPSGRGKVVLITTLENEMKVILLNASGERSEQHFLSGRRKMDKYGKNKDSDPRLHINHLQDAAASKFL